MSLYDLNGKKILTVTGSGDQVFNALLSVDKIDTFDINQFAYYFMILKKYAIIVLEYDEFFTYFLNKNSSFDIKIYNKIKSYLGEYPDVRNFFDYIFNMKEANYIKKTGLFVYNDYDDEDVFARNNLYLEVDNYYMLKGKLLDTEINFKRCNITSLSENFDEAYDYIFISNITDYLTNIFNDNHLKKYKKLLLQDLSKILELEGKVVSYLYNGLMGREDNSFERRQVLGHCFEELPLKQDKILVYTKGGKWMTENI